MAYDLPAGAIHPAGFNLDEVAFPPTFVRSFANLRYGKALQEGLRRPGRVPVYGTNGRCGWHDTALAQPPGVILGRKGQGHLGVEWCEVPFWVIDTAYFADLDRRSIDPRWFYYITNYVGLDELKTGEKPGLNRDTFLAQVFPLPPLDDQRAIAEVLGALDDKIELNRQMNHTLEEMASALFKSWFIDFDPVVAKAEGRKPFGMDAATAALFTGSFESSEDGDFPAGWRWVSLRDVTDKIGSGATPTGGSQVYRDTGVSLIRSQNVYDSQFTWDGLAYIGDAHAKALDGVTVKADDVLINITGASFLRTCMVDPAVLPARVNQHVAIVRAARGVPPRFLHLNLVRPWMKEFLAGHDAGGSRQAITKAHLEGVPVLLPPRPVLDVFAARIGPWFGLVEANERESRTLTTLRDALLPKLLSGEIRLKQAEKVVAAAL